MATKPTAAPKPASLAALFGLDEDDGANEAPVTFGLPPATTGLPALTRTRPVPSMQGKSPLFFEVARGGGGKTTFARYIGGELAQRGGLDRFILAALDPGTRALAQYFAAVQQPKSADPTEIATWLKKLLAFLTQNQAGGNLDFGGGGEVALRQVVQSSPGMCDLLMENGIAPIGTYFFSPAIDDLALLEGMEAIGFQPQATLLLLNLAKGTPSEFAPLRRQPAYKAALDRGAVELWLPALEPRSVALEIERKRFLFHEARDGVVPEGNSNQPLAPFDRVAVRDWMLRMEESLRPIREAGWLPWA